MVAATSKCDNRCMEPTTRHAHATTVRGYASATSHDEAHHDAHAIRAAHDAHGNAAAADDDAATAAVRVQHDGHARAAFCGWKYDGPLHVK